MRVNKSPQLKRQEDGETCEQDGDRHIEASRAVRLAAVQSIPRLPISTPKSEKKRGNVAE